MLRRAYPRYQVHDDRRAVIGFDVPADLDHMRQIEAGQDHRLAPERGTEGRIVDQPVCQVLHRDPVPARLFHRHDHPAAAAPAKLGFLRVAGDLPLAHARSFCQRHE